MILIISLIDKKNSLHFEEFVRPVIDIVGNNFQVVNYENISKEIIIESSKVIICGNSLKEENHKSFEFNWIKEYKKPMLGICAGAQVIAKAFGSNIKEGKEIGVKNCQIIEEDTILKDVNLDEVYLIHRFYFEVPTDFQLIAQTKYPQIVKKTNIYCVLFHPEVKNKKLVENFVKLI